MRRARNHARGRAAHFFQFRHQIGLGLQAAGGIDDDVIDIARARRMQGIEQHRARIGAGFLPDDFGRGTFSPDLELLDRRGAKRIGGAQEHAAAFSLIAADQLTDAGGLPRPIDAHHHHDRRRLVHVRQRTLGCLQDLEQVLANQAA